MRQSPSLDRNSFDISALTHDILELSDKSVIWRGGVTVFHGDVNGIEDRDGRGSGRSLGRPGRQSMLVLDY